MGSEVELTGTPEFRRIRLSTRSASVDRCGCPIEGIDREREDFLAQGAKPDLR